ncbi:helix-turn-helix domain-containing protein [Natronococcus wangiae]|uniref:helix-turn-helix domain-containing protein n=1 Tax=Natronococcus wangiae TaxID=3068275 RepID=UPI002740194E|nr:helix-turn-helix domain-containing protein [Natronococcus sp. AD5]
MSIVAEFTIPTNALPAGDTLAKNPDVQIEIERIVPTQESALPFFWVWGPDPETFMERVEQEPNVAEVDLLARVDDGALFRADWAPDAEIIQGIKRLNAVIIEAIGTSEQWRFQVRTQEREAFNEFRELFLQQGITVHLDRLYSLSELVEGDAKSITPLQRDTLIAAYRGGYFEQPRQTTQEEIAKQFNVSPRAVSDRIRRVFETSSLPRSSLPGSKREHLAYRWSATLPHIYPCHIEPLALGTTSAYRPQNACDRR